MVIRNIKTTDFIALLVLYFNQTLFLHALQDFIGIFCIKTTLRSKIYNFNVAYLCSSLF